MNNFFGMISQQVNHTQEGFQLSDNARCWLPFGEMSALLTLTTILVILTRKVYTAIKSSKLRGLFRRIASKNTVFPAPIAEYGREISLFPFRNNPVNDIQSNHPEIQETSFTITNTADQQTATRPMSMSTGVENLAKNALILPAILITPPYPRMDSPTMIYHPLENPSSESYSVHCTPEGFEPRHGKSDSQKHLNYVEGKDWISRKIGFDRQHLCILIFKSSMYYLKLQIKKKLGGGRERIKITSHFW